MKHAIALLPLALAACGSKPTVSAENASVAEVAEKVKASGPTMQLNPGRWEAKVAIDRIDIPNLPPEVAANMRNAAANQVAASCLTPEEAKKPAAEFFGGKDRKDCRYDHFTMGGGNLDAQLTCGDTGGKAQVTMKGTYSPDNFRIAMTTRMVSTPGAPAKAMSIAATIDSRRVSECKGDER